MPVQQKKYSGCTFSLMCRLEGEITDGGGAGISTPWQHKSSAPLTIKI
jgi:hypothetical protein